MYDPHLTNPPNDRNNDEFDSPPSEITPPSRDPPAKVAPAVQTTVELAERRRATALCRDRRGHRCGRMRKIHVAAGMG